MKLKSTNIQWVDTIPSHWKIKELKYCLLPGSEGIKIGPFGSALKSEMLVNKGYKVYGQENLIKDNFNLGQRFISEEKFNELKAYEISEKDVLISMMGTVGRCKVVPSNTQKGIMDSHLIRIRFNENLILPEFATYLIQDSNYIKVQLDLNSKGSIMSGLNSSIIKKLKLILPPIEEQKLILKYINKESRDLNQLIASKNYMIDLLNQQRQSIITEAITKGLNPNAKMKDSGVEWIGEIPKHWKLVKIKHLIVSSKGAIKTGPFGSQLTNNDMNGNDVKIYNQRTVLDNDFVKGDYYISTKKYEELKSFEVCPGDILITSRGTIGKAAMVPDNIECGILHPCLIRMQLCPNLIDYKLIQIIFNETNFIKRQIELLSNATTIEVIYSETLKNLSIVLPSKKEQQELLIYIENILNDYNELICTQKKQIEKLKEYRQALIYEVVTGKIDVLDMELDLVR
jgi:type I restriction enzyme, S subunit